MVRQPVQHGTGEGAVVVEDFGPVFLGLVGGQQDGPLVTLADELERGLSRVNLGQLSFGCHRSTSCPLCSS